MTSRILCAFLVALLAVGAATAQETTKDAKPAASESAPPPPPKPSPEIKKFADTFAGRWQFTARMEDGPFAPGGDSGSGIAVMENGPGGMSVMSRIDAKFAKMGKFNGLGATYWDAKEKVYKGFWCDSMTPTCESSGRGNWQGGDRFVIENEMDMGGQKLAMRDEMFDIKPDSFSEVMYMGEPGTELKKSMTFTYKRIGGPAKAAKKQNPK